MHERLDRVERELMRIILSSLSYVNKNLVLYYQIYS